MPIPNPPRKPQKRTTAKATKTQLDKFKELCESEKIDTMKPTNLENILVELAKQPKDTK